MEILTQHNQIVLATHVNLVDMVGNSGPVTKFDTVQELSDYTKDNGKYFPKEVAYAGELLRYLLRHILNPSQDRRRGQNGNRGQRGRGRDRRGKGGGR